MISQKLFNIMLARVAMCMCGGNNLLLHHQRVGGWRSDSVLKPYHQIATLVVVAGVFVIGRQLVLMKQLP